jgi:hypothetical protein
MSRSRAPSIERSIVDDHRSRALHGPPPLRPGNKRLILCEDGASSFQQFARIVVPLLTGRYSQGPGKTPKAARSRIQLTFPVI